MCNMHEKALKGRNPLRFNLIHEKAIHVKFGIFSGHMKRMDQLLLLAYIYPIGTGLLVQSSTQLL